MAGWRDSERSRVGGGVGLGDEHRFFFFHV